VLGIYPGEVDKVIDHLEQMQAALVDIPGVVLVAPPVVTELPFLDHFGESDDGIERRAQLVGDAGQAGLKLFIPGLRELPFELVLAHQGGLEHFQELPGGLGILGGGVEGLGNRRAGSAIAGKASGGLVVIGHAGDPVARPHALADIEHEVLVTERAARGDGRGHPAARALALLETEQAEQAAPDQHLRWNAQGGRDRRRNIGQIQPRIGFPQPVDGRAQHVVVAQAQT
jgi:hypothetical protein